MRKRPFVADFDSSTGGVGNGVVGAVPTGVFGGVPPFAVRFAEVRRVASRVPWPPRSPGLSLPCWSSADGAPALANAQRPENGHLAAVVDEDGHVTLVDTNASVRAAARRGRRRAPNPD